MNKDVIYIDVEDDITAIIGKVKAAKARIVALVPPKRIGVLQSAVNLRLLMRAAEGADKRLVLITNNAALTALSASAKIPVAKNLQSKPELAEIAALEVDDDDDIIDGAQLPVADHAKTAEATRPVIEAAEAAESADILEDKPEGPTKKTSVEPAPVAPRANKPPAKGRAKIPNFNSFRKKLFFGIGAGVLLIGFLVWALVFAPHATVVITAETTPLTATLTPNLSPDATTSLDKNTLKTIVQQSKDQVSTDVTPTGTKDVGEKAQGTVQFRNCETMTSQTIPSGTYIAVNNLNYVTQAAVVVPGGSGNFVTGCTTPGVSGDVKVVATDIGDQYNASSGVNFTVAGHAAAMAARSSSAITGGSKRTIKVLTDSDVQGAQDKLTSSDASTAARQKLASQFGNDVIVLQDSFVATKSDATASPAVGEEVTGTAKLTASVTYTMTGIQKAEAKSLLGAYYASQLKGKTNQRIYTDGTDSIKTANLVMGDKGAAAKVTLTATAEVGPQIDDKAVKQQVMGKRYGEIQSSLQSIEGVSSVDTKFSPFWVRTVPNDANKITIEFKINTNGS